MMLWHVHTFHPRLRSRVRMTDSERTTQRATCGPLGLKASPESLSGENRGLIPPFADERVCRHSTKGTYERCRPNTRRPGGSPLC
jgi:hypothetical protein